MVTLLLIRLLLHPPIFLFLLLLLLPLVLVPPLALGRPAPRIRPLDHIARCDREREVILHDLLGDVLAEGRCWLPRVVLWAVPRPFAHVVEEAADLVGRNHDPRHRGVPFYTLWFEVRVDGARELFRVCGYVEPPPEALGVPDVVPMLVRVERHKLVVERQGLVDLSRAAHELHRHGLLAPVTRGRVNTLTEMVKTLTEGVRTWPRGDSW
ncbi:hypothetical protein T484DRAFT_1986747 [Baffinella frigidus]|nr:hypothetical protein T484DRAFT_1986747 [Cryptophyta sp. CCMP2293]